MNDGGLPHIPVIGIVIFKMIPSTPHLPERDSRSPCDEAGSTSASAVPLESRKDHVGHTEIHVRGRARTVPSVQIDGRTVIATGGWLRMASVQDEDLLESEAIYDPGAFISHLLGTGFRADVFTFAQKPPNTHPRFAYHLEWDNLAVIPITTFSHWWEKRVAPTVRTAVRKAHKAGVVVKVAEFDDDLVASIVNINNETPIRQGKPFWHFQKSFDAVKRENSTYGDRNDFLAAYCQDELIGFIRMTYAGRLANIVQLLTLIKHYDKRPANALVAKAVEVCEQKGVSHLVYCNYIYNDPKSSLTEFKRRNGFEKMLVPRYYVPLTTKGMIALNLGLHRGLVHCMPKPLTGVLLGLRNLWYQRKAARKTL